MRLSRSAILAAALRTFEGSDALGNGDFSICAEAATLIEQLLNRVERLTAELESERAQKDAIAAHFTGEHNG